MTESLKLSCDLKGDYSKRLLFLGFIAGLGILLPYLGRTADFGIHARVWSTLALLFSVGYAFKLNANPLNLAHKFDFTAILLLFILCISFASGEQIAELLSPSLNGAYTDRKLAILFYAAILPATMVRLLLVVKQHRCLYTGILSAFLLLSLVAAVVVFNYWDYIYMATNAVTRQLRALNEVSTIALSLVFSVAYFSAFIITTSRRNFYLIKLPYLLFVVLMIILLRQRAHLILIILLTLPVVIINWSKRDFLIIFSLFIVVATAIFISVDLATFSETKLSRYWVKVLEGQIFDTRIPIYQAAIDGIMANPWGQGLAAFAVNHPMWTYPHNPVLEAFYELGLFGGLLMISVLLHISYVALKLYGSALFSQQKDPLCFAYGSILILLLFHQLKAGGIESIGLLLMVWFLAVALLSNRHMNDSLHQSNSD